jgi:hypothetical protein
MDHWNSSPPWTSLYCRPEELHKAQPMAAPGLEAVDQGQGRGGVAHRQLDEPLTGAQAAARRPDNGEGWRRLKAHIGGVLRCERENREDGVG